MICSHDINRFKQSPPRPPALVTVKAIDRASPEAGEKANAMACEWNVPVSFDPPLLAVSVGFSRASMKLLQSASAFGVAYVPWDKTWLLATVGACSMNQVGDKFSKFGIEFTEDEEYGVPVIKEVLTYVCTRFTQLNVGDHCLFVGKAVKVYAPSEERVLGSLYVGGGVFSPLSIEGVRAERLRGDAGVKMPGYDYQEVERQGE